MRDHREGMNPEIVDITALVREYSAPSIVRHRLRKANNPKKPVQTKIGQGGKKARKILRRQR